MDLGEKADLCDYEKIHRLIESTYKNILKNFNPCVKQLNILGKALQKTIQNVGASFKAYNECLIDIARSAESCKGSTKELGIGLLQLTNSQSTINQHLSDSIKVFHAELLIPLKAKQETEFRHVQVIYDKYLAGHKYQSNNLRKAQNALEKYKKRRSKSGQKELEKTRHMKECKRKLEEYLRKNLRLALLEERKRYCYLFNRLLCVVEDRVSKYTKETEMLTEGLRNWPELCRSPHILPSATEQVIHDFGFSGESCDLEDEASCDGEHGDTRVNPRSQKHDSLPGYDWSTRDTAASAAVAAIEEMQRKHSVTLMPSSRRHLFDTSSQEERTQQPIPSVLCAVYPYVAATETQLSLDTNDVIRIHGDVQNGWLFGRNIRTDKEGWFPLSFTDFNEELLQWKPAYVRNSSLTNLRNTWFTEVDHDFDRRPSRCSESDASDAAIAAAEAARSARVNAPATRPVPYSVLAVSPDAANNSLTRSKLLNRRILSLEPISENIPPPEEFRDRGDQVIVGNDRVVHVTSTNLEVETTRVSLTGAQTAEDWRARTQTKDDVTQTENQPSAGNATGNQSSVASKRSAAEPSAEDVLPQSEVSGGGNFTSRLVEPEALPPMPPPPSPLPPLPPLPGSASTNATRPPRYTNTAESATQVSHAGYSFSTRPSKPRPDYPADNRDRNDTAINVGNSTVTTVANEGNGVSASTGAVNPGNVTVASEGSSALANAGPSTGNDAGIKPTRSVALSRTPAQSTGTAEDLGSSGVSQPTPDPPPQRPPPPPPPPLPLGSYHSIRGELFARPRLRKTLSMDSTKIN